MPYEYALPDVGEGVAEGEIVRWLVEPGDEVTEDQPLAEIETDKALVELPSPVDGLVQELHAEPGDVVPVGTVVVTLEVEGDAGAEAASANDTTETVTDRSDHVFAPPRVRVRAREAGVTLEDLEGTGPAGAITAADLERALADPPPVETTDGQETQEPTAERDRTLAAPAARRVAREEGVDLEAVPAVERREGEAFVTPEAVRQFARSDRQPGQPERREPLSGVRRTIAARMVESLETAAHVTHHDSADVTALVDARERLAERAADRDIRLTYLPLVIRAVVAALAEYPRFNARLDEAAEELVYRNTYNIGIATATDEGLMVPVVENAAERGLLELASTIDELVERTRERSVSPEALQGSTFTITNVGAIGGEYATPILNREESGILALGAIERRPRVVDGSVEARHTLPLSLSFDHRVADGADAARFTNAIIERLEQPALLLLE